jgi:hypothetical protein
VLTLTPTIVDYHVIKGHRRHRPLHCADPGHDVGHGAPASTIPRTPPLRLSDLRQAAMTRRDNLKRSGDELKGQLDDAKAALGEALKELKKVELLDKRD